MFDVALALVTRFVQNLAVVGIRQVGRQECDGRERDRASGQQLQHNRKPARGPSGFDSSIGGVLGQVQDLGAVGK